MGRRAATQEASGGMEAGLGRPHGACGPSEGSGGTGKGFQAGEQHRQVFNCKHPLPLRLGPPQTPPVLFSTLVGTNIALFHMENWGSEVTGSGQFSSHESQQGLEPRSIWLSDPERSPVLWSLPLPAQTLISQVRTFVVQPDSPSRRTGHFSPGSKNRGH